MKGVKFFYLLCYFFIAFNYILILSPPHPIDIFIGEEPNIIDKFDKFLARHDLYNFVIFFHIEIIYALAIALQADLAY
jgi:hypothetical protein